MDLRGKIRLGLLAIIFVLALGTVGYTISVLTQYIIQSEILSLSGRRRVLKLAAKLHDHYIICGAGRVGAQVAHEMIAAGERFIVIERDAQVAEQLLQQDYLVLVGDATREETLKPAEIHSARGIVCAASGEFNLATSAGSDALGLEAILISENSDFVHKSLKDSGIRSRLNLIIAAIRRQDGQMLFNPSAAAVILPGDRLYATGKRSDLAGLENLATGKHGG